MEKTKVQSLDVTLSSTQTICQQWAQLIPSVALRIAQELDDEVSIRIGNLDYQPAEITIYPSQKKAEFEDSQACYRYMEGNVVFTTAWDSEWTDITPEKGTDFKSWLHQALQQLIAKYIGWGPERLRESYEKTEVTDFSIESWAQELHELVDSGLDRSLIPNQLSPFLPLATDLIGALEGLTEATRKIANALRKRKKEFENIDSVASVILRFVTPKLTEANLELFVEITEEWLDHTLQQVANSDSPQHQTLRNIVSIAEGAAHPIQLKIQSTLDLPSDSFPSPKKMSIILKAEYEYSKLLKDWQHFQPSCKNPLKKGEFFIALENRINQAWREHLQTVPESMRLQTRHRILYNRRFVCGATDAVLSWMRIHKHYDRAVEIFTQQLQDIELTKLRYESNPRHFEHMISSAFGAFLDSKQDEHLTQALALIETLEEHFQWTHGQCEYQLACVYARADLKEKALTLVEQYVSHGGSSSYIATDEDLAALHKHPRFIAAIEAMRSNASSD